MPKLSGKDLIITSSTQETNILYKLSWEFTLELLIKEPWPPNTCWISKLSSIPELPLVSVLPTRLEIQSATLILQKGYAQGARVMEVFAGTQGRKAPSNSICRYSSLTQQTAQPFSLFHSPDGASCGLMSVSHFSTGSLNAPTISLKYHFHII